MLPHCTTCNFANTFFQTLTFKLFLYNDDLDIICLWFLTETNNVEVILGRSDAF